MKQTALTNLFLSSLGEFAVTEHIFYLVFLAFRYSCIHVAQIQYELAKATRMLPQGTLDWEENYAKERPVKIFLLYVYFCFCSFEADVCEERVIDRPGHVVSTEKRDDYILQKLSCTASVKSSSFAWLVIS